MFTIAKIFGKSPFPFLEHHMEKVKKSMQTLQLLFKALDRQDDKKIEVLAKEIFKLEEEADEKKMNIRTHLPKSLFLPIDRSMILEILSLQDQLANKSRDIAMLATLKSLEQPTSFKVLFHECQKSNFEVFDLTYHLIKEFDFLLESSFGGLEAAKVKKIIDELEKKQKESTHLKYKLLKKIYHQKFSSPNDFSLWLSMIGELSELSEICQKLGHRMLVLLETK